jgi:tetratricopeptide (TPR) repeat protein
MNVYSTNTNFKCGLNCRTLNAFVGFVTTLVLISLAGCSTPSQPSTNFPASRIAEQTPAAAAASQQGITLVKNAEAAYTKGDWRVAAAEYKKLTEVYPRNSQMWFSLGTSYALLGSLDESAKALEIAASIDPRDARAAYNLALVRLNQAEAALKNAEANVPPNSPLRQEITKILSGIKSTFSSPPPVTTGAVQSLSPAYASSTAEAADSKPINSTISVMQPR